MNDAINFEKLHEMAEAGDDKAWDTLHHWCTVADLYTYTLEWTPASLVLGIDFDQARSRIFTADGQRREPTLDEYAEAFNIYTDLAGKGYTKAVELLLKWYSAGIYVKQDYKKCVDLMWETMDFNNPLFITYAFVDLAFCYANGIGVEKNFDTAYSMLTDDFLCFPENTFPELYRGSHPTFLYPYQFTISEGFLDYCRIEKEDENAAEAYALYRSRPDQENGAISE